MNSIGLGLPWAIIGIPLVLGWLVYVYRQRGQGLRLPVSTVLLLKQLKSVSRSRRSFKPPLRFFFELLGLSLLVLALAQLYRVGTEERYTILIDNSLSSGQLDSSQTPQVSLENAKQQVRSFLGSLTASAKIELFTTSPQLQALGDGPVSPREATAALDQVAVAFTADDLETALTRLAERTDVGQIMLTTDRPISDQSPTSSVRPLYYRSANDPGTRGNVAILAINAQATNASEAGSEVLELKLGNFSLSASAVTVSLEALESNQDEVRFRPIQSQTLELAAREVSTIKLRPKPGSWRAFKISLSTTSPVAQDVLKLDNVAYLSREASTQSIEVKSDLSLGQLGLQRISTFPFTQQNTGETSSAKSRGIIFHRHTPTTFPDQASLVIFPQTSSAVVEIGKEAQQARITHLELGHPLLNYLSTPKFSIPRLSPLKTPAWATAVIETDKGVAAYAGEYHGVRSVVFGFELLPFDGSKNPAISILTLNALTWLYGSQGGVGFEGVYNKLNLPESDLISLEGAKLATSGSGSLTKTVATSPGIIQEKASGKVHAINALIDSESDVAGTRPLSLKPFTTVAGKSVISQLPLIQTLLQIVALLLILDLLFAIIGGLRSRLRGAKSA